MKHIFLSSILTIVIATPLGILAQTPDLSTVRGLREAFAAFPSSEHFLWAVYAGGAMDGANAGGIDCTQPGSTHFTTAELAAYLQYTARPTEKPVFAILQFHIDKKCLHPLQAGQASQLKEWAKGWAEGLTTGLTGGRKALAEELLQIRTTEDRAALEEHVRRADDAGADLAARVAGVVAGARLLELSREGLRPREKSVPTTR